MNVAFIFRKHITPQQYPREFSEINDVSPENEHCGDYRVDVDIRFRISLLTLTTRKLSENFISQVTESLVRVMKTHISEIEKERKSEDQTNIKLLNNTSDKAISSASDTSCEDAARQSEHINTNARTKELGSIAIGSCFVCDPDWCPDYQKRLCNGKRLT
jgi:hypothetical protein